MKKAIVLLLICLVSAYCGKNKEIQRVEITQTFTDGNTKILSKYSKVKGVETMVERVTYNKYCQVMIIEKPVAQTQNKFQWHKNGIKKSVVSFHAGKKHGAWIVWYSNGTIKNESFYHQGQLQRQATYTTFITTESFYTKGQLSTYREYKDGILAIQTSYSEGKIIKKKYFYPDGQKSDERNYKNGLIHGKCIFWDRNGEKKSETIYQDGKPVVKN